MDRNIISMSAENWFTVFIMVVLPLVVIGFGLNMLYQVSGSRNA